MNSPSKSFRRGMPMVEARDSQALQQEIELLQEIDSRSHFWQRWKGYMKLSGPGWLQSAVTLGAGSAGSSINFIGRPCCPDSDVSPASCLRALDFDPREESCSESKISTCTTGTLFITSDSFHRMITIVPAWILFSRNQRRIFPQSWLGLRVALQMRPWLSTTDTRLILDGKRLP